jgi:hypothetical protein
MPTGAKGLILMSTVAAFVLLALATVLAGRLLLRWLRNRSSDLAVASKEYDEFYTAAQRLLKADDCTATIAHFTAWLATKAAGPGLARGFVLDIAWGRIGRPDDARHEMSDDLDKLSAPSQELFGQMLASAMISSAASDLLFSRLHQRAITAFLSKTGEPNSPASAARARTAALDLARSGELCFAG